MCFTALGAGGPSVLPAIMGSGLSSKFPWGKGTFIPLQQGKPQPVHGSTWTSASNITGSSLHCFVLVDQAQEEGCVLAVPILPPPGTNLPTLLRFPHPQPLPCSTRTLLSATFSPPDIVASARVRGKTATRLLASRPGWCTVATWLTACL